MARPRFDSLVQVILAGSLLGAPAGACGGGAVGGGPTSPPGIPIENHGTSTADIDVVYVAVVRLLERHQLTSDDLMSHGLARVQAAADRTDGDDAAALAWIAAGNGRSVGQGLWVDSSGNVSAQVPGEFALPALATRAQFDEDARDRG